MSITTCRKCNSVNVRYCCGRETDFDESFGPIGFPPTQEILDIKAYWDALRAKPVEESPFTKMDRLETAIESMGWEIFRLNKSAEMTARAIEIGKVMQAKILELSALKAERRKCL